MYIAHAAVQHVFAAYVAVELVLECFIVVCNVSKEIGDYCMSVCMCVCPCVCVYGLERTSWRHRTLVIQSQETRIPT